MLKQETYKLQIADISPSNDLQAYTNTKTNRDDLNRLMLFVRLNETSSQFLTFTQTANAFSFRSSLLLECVSVLHSHLDGVGCKEDFLTDLHSLPSGV